MDPNPRTNANSNTSLQPTPPLDSSTGPLSQSDTVVYMNQNNKNSHSNLLAGIFVGFLALIIAGIIAIQIYQPQLLASLIIKFNRPSSTPLPIPSVQPSPLAEESPNTGQTKIAFETAKKVIDAVDLNDKSLVVADLLYAYRGQIVDLKEIGNKQFQFTTDKQIAGLPNKWNFNDQISFYYLPGFAKASYQDLKIGSKVFLTTSFGIKEDQPFKRVNEFGLIYVGLLNSSSELFLPAQPTDTANDASNLSNLKPIEVKDVSTKIALDNAKNVMAQIDLSDDNVERFNLLYVYKGTITDLKKMTDQKYQITTDTKVAGLPDTWTFDEQINVLQLPNFEVVEKSKLKIGDKVRVGIYFVVKGNRNYETPNQFVLTSISIYP